MEDQAVLLGLHECPGIGWATIDALVGRCDRLSQLVERMRGRWLEQLGLRATQIEALRTQMTPEGIAQRQNFYAKQSVHVVTPFDAHYPELLRHSARRPWVLYGKGNWSLVHRPTVAIVGTRSPSPYGCEVTAWFAESLAQIGICIVSGLARGIDTEAHRGALRVGGATIAVLGTGLNVHYPPEHFALQRQIAEQALVISLLPWNARPTKHAFLQRNDVIAGLSVGTVVVEAAVGSGSLHTADCALAHNREVMGVPGRVTSPNSVGVLKRLQEGATMVLSPEEVLHACNLSEMTSTIIRQECVQTTDAERRLLRQIGTEEVSLDDLYEQSDGSLVDLHAALMSLLQKRLIQACGGSMYRATRRAMP